MHDIRAVRDDRDGFVKALARRGVDATAIADDLLTKDKALLELARNRARPTSFRILTPLAFLSSGSAGRADA